MSEKSLIEAALFVSGGVVSLKELEKITLLEQKVVKGILEQLQAEYEQRGSGIMIENAGKGYAMRVRPVFEEKVMPLIPETDLPKSVLKTLALIAHEQPIKQTTVVKLRGNRVYHYLHRLEELGFIQGRPDGRTRLLTTTPKFHEYFRLQDVRTLNLGAVAGDTEPKQTILEIPPEAQCEAEDD